MPPLGCDEQVFAILSKATENRAVAKTQMNERSSRSHSVFRLKITGRNTMTGELCDATLNLVDLAGSHSVHNGNERCCLELHEATNMAILKRSPTARG